MTSRRRTSSASTTVCASSTASSSPTSSATATCAPTSPSSPWTSSASAGPMRPNASSSQYESQAGERLPRPLLHHYIAQRAYVRAKVACLQFEQGSEGARRRRQGTARAGPSTRTSQPSGAGAGRWPPRDRQEHARRRAGGRDGVGPSALGRDPPGAATLGGAHADRRRPERRYTPAAVGAVYDELVRRARQHLDRRASRSSSMRRGSMPGSGRRRGELPPTPRASSWSSAVPVRSRGHGTDQRAVAVATTTPPRRRRRSGPSWPRGWMPGRRPP